jgi:hypothetical protein
VAEYRDALLSSMHLFDLCENDRILVPTVNIFMADQYVVGPLLQKYLAFYGNRRPIITVYNSPPLELILSH